MERDGQWRASVLVPREIEEAVIRMRQRDEFARCTISEMLRKLLEKGLEAYGYAIDADEKSA